MRVRRISIRASRALALLSVVALAESWGAPRPARAGEATSESRVTAVATDPASPEVVSSPAGPYARVFGTITGQVSAGEDVRGLTGPTKYTVKFELTFPAETPSSLLLVDAENRGAAVSPLILDSALFDGRRSWARVQWQTGIAAAVPEEAQGIGLVIVRDFGRMLAGENGAALLDQLGVKPYRDRVLVGVSQSAWFVDTFIAEGFNRSPSNRGHGVYQAALTIDGAGNWLAINNLAGDAPETPYVLPNAAPLQAEQILRHPASDPFLVDVAAYTDFYRLRAGLTEELPTGARRTLPTIARALGRTATPRTSANPRTSSLRSIVKSVAPRPDQMRRYDVPAAHAPAAFASPQIVFEVGHCNNGSPIGLNPVDYRPYARALLVAIENELVARRSESQPITGRSLPPSTTFELGPVSPDALTFNGLQAFNPLPGVEVPVPRVDRDRWPIGGVRDPQADHPLGRPTPPAIPHVGTDDIGDVCGNFGGYQPFTKSELADRYGSQAAYLDSVAASVDALIAQGFVLPFDRQGMLAQAAAIFSSAP